MFFRFSKARIDDLHAIVDLSMYNYMSSNILKQKSVGFVGTEMRFHIVYWSHLALDYSLMNKNVEYLSMFGKRNDVILINQSEDIQHSLIAENSLRTTEGKDLLPFFSCQFRIYSS